MLSPVLAIHSNAWWWASSKLPRPIRDSRALMKGASTSETGKRDPDFGNGKNAPTWNSCLCNYFLGSLTNRKSPDRLISRTDTSLKVMRGQKGVGRSKNYRSGWILIRVRESTYFVRFATAFISISGILCVMSPLWSSTQFSRLWRCYLVLCTVRNQVTFWSSFFVCVISKFEI